MNAQAGAQVNVEYLFRLFYDCLVGACYGSVAGITALFANLWVWITVIGYLVAFAGLALIVYCTMRIFALRHEEEEKYGAVHIAADEGPENPRWKNIESLIAADNPSGWREAIIEADIMLGDMLAKRGYRGDSIGDQLKQISAQDFETINDAWEAHKVRNQIAHDGSAFDLSHFLARRTIGRYENVFREFGAI